MTPRGARAAARLPGWVGLPPLLVAVTAVLLVAGRPADTPAGPPTPSSRLVAPDRLGCAAFPLASGVVGAATEVGELIDGDSWETSRVPAADAADLLVRAGARQRLGAAAYTAQVLPAGAGGGLVVQLCAAPARRWWFVGAGSATERESTLVLNNVDATDAVVDVVLRGTDGPLEAVGTEGLRVPARQSLTLPLGELVAGADEIAVDVEATQGRVVAAVADDWSGGVRDLGSEWLPATSAPATQVLLPGLVAPGPRSLLVVANPGDASTPVELSLVDQSGTFVPTSADTEVTVPAGGVATLPVPDQAAQTTGLLVAADSPITATVRSATGVDIGYGVAPTLIEQPAVVAIDLGAAVDGAGPRLVLAAELPTGGAATTPAARQAEVTAYDAAGTVTGSSVVEVSAGTAQVVALAADLDLTAASLRDTAYVVVDPDNGADTSLVAAAVWRAEDGRLAVLPLESGVNRLSLPLVLPAVRP